MTTKGMTAGNADQTWEKEISGRIFTFSKVSLEGSAFLYNCEVHSDSVIGPSILSTGFHSFQNLTAEQVEHLPSFAEFISGRNKAASA
jgi:hypothetical protein